MEKRFVYADNSATTKISKAVLDAMMPYLTENYGNPSSIYKLGRDSRRAVETARENHDIGIGIRFGARPIGWTARTERHLVAAGAQRRREGAEVAFGTRDIRYHHPRGGRNRGRA